ncbi:viral ankyrin 4 [Diadegma semiclausum ichnovirus]|nr:viral ankyrin 4 [Diadegma semiclausum ichnovirus]
MNKSEIAKFLGRNPITGDTIFHELAAAGSVSLLNRIREIFGGPYDSFINKLNGGATCVHVAAKLHRAHRAIQVIELLVEMGADLNASDYLSGATVLHHAVWYEDRKLVTWLCQQSPRINLDARRRDGLTAYQMAFLEQNGPMKKILQDHGANCEEPQEPGTPSSGPSH